MGRVKTTKQMRMYCPVQGKGAVMATVVRREDESSDEDLVLMVDRCI